MLNRNANVGNTWADYFHRKAQHLKDARKPDDCFCGLREMQLVQDGFFTALDTEGATPWVVEVLTGAVDASRAERDACTRLNTARNDLSKEVEAMREYLKTIEDALSEESRLGLEEFDRSRTVGSKV